MPMKIGMIGINHKSAELSLREKFAVVCQKWFGETSPLQGLVPHVLLLTCNRIEIYFSAEDLAESHIFLLGILRGEIHSEFEHTLYSFFGKDCFLHLAKVTSGMDSALIGETEIQGQVKNAYAWASHHPLNKELHFLFQKSLKIGKDLRTRGLCKSPSLSQGISSLCKNYFQFPKVNALLIGFSRINLTLYHAFRNEAWIEPFLCNRTIKTDQCLPWEERERWDQYDLIICSTKSPNYVLSASQMEGKNIQTPKLILDLSMPRNVFPEAKHPLIRILNIDQLHETFHQKKSSSYQSCLETIGHLVTKQCLLYENREIKVRGMIEARKG